MELEFLFSIIFDFLGEWNKQQACYVSATRLLHSSARKVFLIIYILFPVGRYHEISIFSKDNSKHCFFQSSPFLDNYFFHGRLQNMLFSYALTKVPSAVPGIRKIITYMVYNLPVYFLRNILVETAFPPPCGNGYLELFGIPNRMVSPSINSASGLSFSRTSYAFATHCLWFHQITACSI